MLATVLRATGSPPLKSTRSTSQSASTSFCLDTNLVNVPCRPLFSHRLSRRPYRSSSQSQRHNWLPMLSAERAHMSRHVAGPRMQSRHFRLRNGPRQLGRALDTPEHRDSFNFVVWPTCDSGSGSIDSGKSQHPQQDITNIWNFEYRLGWFVSSNLSSQNRCRSTAKPNPK